MIVTTSQLVKVVQVLLDLVGEGQAPGSWPSLDSPFGWLELDWGVGVVCPSCLLSTDTGHAWVLWIMQLSQFEDASNDASHTRQMKGKSMSASA
jgi:hypothetical protein